MSLDDGLEPTAPSALARPYHAQEGGSTLYGCFEPGPFIGTSGPSCTHEVMARTADGRVGTAKIGTRRSPAGVMDIVFGAMLIVPLVGLTAPGSHETHRAECRHSGSARDAAQRDPGRAALTRSTE